jgi:hypothetical protein
MDKRIWFSRRAVRLHVVILVVVPAFMALCLWQVSRAVGGNELSWAYVFEWPIFAAYAVYMWWRFVHERPEAVPSPDDPAPQVDGDSAIASTEVPEQGAVARAPASEDAEMAAYNEYLAQLAAKDEAQGESHVDRRRLRPTRASKEPS